VHGKRNYKDGTRITTSVVARHQRFHTHAVTESGTVYLLAPRQLATAPAAASSSEADGGEVRGVVANLKRSAPPPAPPLGGSSTLAPGPSTLCSICRDECDAAAANWKRTPCQHAFHEECLSAWVAHQAAKKLPPSCPDCRHLLSASRLRLFESGGESVPEA